MFSLVCVDAKKNERKKSKKSKRKEKTLPTNKQLNGMEEMTPTPFTYHDLDYVRNDKQSSGSSNNNSTY